MRLLVLAAVLLEGIYCVAQLPKVSGLDCKAKIVALYDAGPNWANAAQYVPMHLQFLRTQLNQGTIAVGGPFTGGEPGGLVVFNVADQKQADVLLQEDPFVAKKVVIYTTRSWAHCQADSAPSTPKP